MAIYLLYMASPAILFVLVEFFTHKKINRNDRLRTAYFVMFAVIMALMIGLRHPSNGSDDTLFYYYQWERFGNIEFGEIWYYIKNTDMEMGYLFVVWILSHILEDGQWLLVLSGLFFAISICMFVKRNCKDPVLALVAFNCLGLFNFMVQGLRQAIAMCICIWAIEPCKQRRPVRFMLMVALASLFHASAVLFSVVYLLAGLKLDVRFMLIFAVGTLIVLAQLPNMFQLVNRLLNDSYAIGRGSESGGWIAILIYVAIIFFGVLFKERNNPHYPLYIYMCIIGAEGMLLRQSVSGIVERVSYYFAFSQMVVVANSVSTIKARRMRILVCMAVFALCFFVAVHKTTYSSLIPYRFFWY